MCSAVAMQYPAAITNGRIVSHANRVYFTNSQYYVILVV